MRVMVELSVSLFETPADGDRDNKAVSCCNNYHITPSQSVSSEGLIMMKLKYHSVWMCCVRWRDLWLIVATSHARACVRVAMDSIDSIRFHLQYTTHDASERAGRTGETEHMTESFQLV